MRNVGVSTKVSPMRAMFCGLGWLVGMVGAVGASDRTVLPALSDPVLVLHVAPSGDDANPGTPQRPFASLERARDEIRERRRQASLNPGVVQVLVHGGEYRVERTFRLTQQDSGSGETSIRYCAVPGERPRFTGGVLLGTARAVTDPSVRERLPVSVRDSVVEWDLVSEGVTDLIPFALGGFSSGRGFQTHPAMELFVDDRPMILARWPNAGFVMTADVSGPLTLKAWDNKPGTPEGRFIYEGDRPERWVGEPDAWLYGYWFWDWADSYEKIESIDVDRREIALAKPWHRYGYRKQQRYHALNVLCELDAPGEYYLDRERQRLYLFPPRDWSGRRVELSVTALPLVEFDNVSQVRFEGLLWELGAADGIRIRGGERCVLLGCTVRKLAGNGIEIRGGSGHVVMTCDIHTLGRGGTVIAGGDRKTLTPGGHVLENCHIYQLSRIDHTYTPGVLLDGVGNRVRHNLIHDVASSAMRVEGNDHLVELNEVHRVVLESDDQGAVDMFGNPTYRGNVFRYNYWHHLGNWDRGGEEAHTGQAGVRLDDAICGTLVQANVFQHCGGGAVGFGGVQIHGGKENRIQGNLFADCRAAVSFTRWGDRRWRESVAKALDNPAIDRDLYLERYPALHRLAEDADRNTVRGNVTLRCNSLLLRSPANTVLEENREIAERDILGEGPDGRLLWEKDVAERLGLGGIPFEAIGLYPDGHRQTSLEPGR